MSTIVGDVLEMGALFSVSAKDIPAFERYMAQLKSYYLDFRYYASLLLILFYTNTFIIQQFPPRVSD
jgi:hypothetical protein